MAARRNDVDRIFHVLDLHITKGKDVQEIAALLRLAPATVMSYIYSTSPRLVQVRSVWQEKQDRKLQEAVNYQGPLTMSTPGVQVDNSDALLEVADGLKAIAEAIGSLTTYLEEHATG